MEKKSFRGGKLEGVIKKGGVFIGLMSVFISHQVSAIEYQGLSGRPAYPDQEIENSKAWFVYNLNPGQVKQDGLEIINSSSEPRSVLIYAADSTKSSSGGFALKQFSQEKEVVGSWVRFYPDELGFEEKELFEKTGNDIEVFCNENQGESVEKWCAGVDQVEIALEPESSVIVPFLFKTPEGLDVGEYTGGILIQEVKTENYNGQGGSSISLTKRIGVRIYQTVPGEIIKNLKVSNFTIEKKYKEFDLKRIFGLKGNDKRLLVKMDVENLGNVSVQHESIITVKNLLNGEKQEVNRNFQVLKNDTFISSYDWSAPWGGIYSFAGEVRYQDENGIEQVVKTNEFVKKFIPWRQVFWSLVGVFVLIGSTVFYWLRYRKMYGGKNWVPYIIKNGDSLNILTAQHSVDWKVLVKTNKVKPPYEFIPGQQILVPPAQVAQDKNQLTSEKKVFWSNVVNVKKYNLKQGVFERVGNFNRVIRRIGIQRSRTKDIVYLGLIIFIVGWVSGIAINNWFGKNELKNVASISLQSPNSRDERVIGSYKVEKVPQDQNSDAQRVLGSEELDDFEVSVLNGAGIPGLAGNLGKFLKENGYRKIKTNNADSYGYQGVKILYKNTYQQQAQSIKELLQKRGYEEVQDVLAEDLESELVIIVGQEK